MARTHHLRAIAGKRFAVAVILLVAGVGLSAHAEADSEKLTEFIISQIVPNDTVRSVFPSREGLVLSYRIAHSHRVFPYLGRRTTVYDSAMAVIALTMAGQYDQAEKIVRGLVTSMPALPRQGADSPRRGDLWFFMNLHNEYPSERDYSGALVRTGPNCWAGYAAAYYIRAMSKDNPRLRRRANVKRYLSFAQQVAAAILSRQITEPDDPRRGLVTGGWGRYRYEVHNGRVVEIFVPGEVEWCSTKYNIDAYYFLQNLAVLTNEKKYRLAAADIHDAVLKNFNHEKGQFNRGVYPQGVDQTMSLDTATFGAVFLSTLGRDDLAAQSLQAVDRYHCVSGDVPGYKPTLDATVHESMDLQKFYYPNNPHHSWNETALVWSEGSMGAAWAYSRLGQGDKGRRIIEALLNSKMNQAGGLLYADRPIEYQFIASPSAASSAWAVIAIQDLEKTVAAKLFLSDPFAKPRVNR